MPCRRRLSFFRHLTIPLVLFHINTAVRLERDILVFEQYTLFCPAGCRASCVINNTVTRIFSVKLGSAKYFSYESRVFVVTGEPRNLTVAGDLAARYFLQNGQNFIYQKFIANRFHSRNPFLVTLHNDNRENKKC